MANEDQPVYCNGCQFFTSDKGDDITKDQYGCSSPNNCFPTWRDPCGEKLPPSVINAENDCNWYKEGSPAKEEKVEIVAFQKMEDLGD